MFVRGMCIFLCCGLFKFNVVLFSTGDIMQKYFNVWSNLLLVHFEYFRKKLFMLKEIKCRYAKSKFEMYLQVHSASQP